MLEKNLRFTLSATNALVVFSSKISENIFESGSAGSDRCGSGSCLQIYRFHIPVRKIRPTNYLKSPAAERGGNKIVFTHRNCLKRWSAPFPRHPDYVFESI